jgi:hypothetical protein
MVYDSVCQMTLFAVVGEHGFTWVTDSDGYGMDEFDTLEEAIEWIVGGGDLYGGLRETVIHG